MRIVSWILFGIGAGVLAGFATGLFRRRPVQPERPVMSYAGGYSAPTPSVDHTASQPARLVVPAGNRRHGQNGPS